MHQEHHLPWNLIAQNFKFVQDNPAFTPRETALFSQNRPSQANELNHFVRVFVNIVSSFSQTERDKYAEPPVHPYPTTGKLFSDELREKYPEYLDNDNQQIEHWIRRARHSEDGTPYYNTGHGYLADIIKILLIENQLATLLLLSHHPQIPLHSLCHLSWGHHFGFSRVMEAALRVYLFFNVVAATGTLDNGQYLQMREYDSMLSELTSSMDYPAQQIPHRPFFRHSGERHFPHEDLAALQEYVKMNFAFLYRYDILMRECGVDPEWEGEMAHALGRLVRGLKVNQEWLPAEEKYTKLVFV